MTSYNSLVNAVKDGDGNTITSTYLKLAGGGNIVGGDYTLGITEQGLTFKYNGTTYGSLLLNYGADGAEFVLAGTELIAKNNTNAYHCSIVNDGSITTVESGDGNGNYEDMKFLADSVDFTEINGSVYGDFVQTSDSRLKTIMADDVLPTVEQVAGAPAVRFKWNELANRKNTDAHLGSIAQYWQNVLPETVTADSKGYLAMQYDVIALISTIALARRITELEKELSEIKQQIKN
jgi:hypothetical protein